MTRQELKDSWHLLEHWKNGGDIYIRKQSGWHLCELNEIPNVKSFDFVIKDKHFEARKAYALGEQVEFYNKLSNSWDEVSTPLWGNCDYRPKPKEKVFEKRWRYLKDGETATSLSSQYVSDDSVFAENYIMKGWYKSEDFIEVEVKQNEKI